jgi:hypothetical protein
MPSSTSRKNSLKMTLIDVAFRYGAQPTDAQTRAMARVRDVYGVWRMTLDAKERTLRVEYECVPSVGTRDRWLGAECGNRPAGKAGPHLRASFTAVVKLL